MKKINPARAFFAHLLSRSRATIVATAIGVVCAIPVAGLAAPGHVDTDAVVSVAQNVDYIGSEAGAALDLGFPVLVPGWVPAPFGGSPSIDGGGGYYSLYWMNAGGEPTFLQVTGQVGGALPAGSPYDLNVQLFVNAQVQGYGAIHDVTPAYDTVWWIAGGVLYKVESRNSATDSLSLANSLISFVPPAAPEPEPEPTSPPAPVEETLEPEPDPATEAPSDDLGSDSGGSTTLPAADETVEDEQLATESPEDVSAAESTVDEAAADEEAVTDEPTAAAPETPAVTPIASDGTGQPSVASDGTGGAQNLVVGGDGTGGTIDIIIPPLP
ncbi:MAG: hypothetical protein H0V37_02885 [Chloroflexia bacterium]|nr:hypothetical protein [Chloroflexia bacterium]